MITLATLAQATEQQVFDQVVAHMIKQGKPCQVLDEFTGVDRCVYRNPEGLKCAAGALIADEEYVVDMDNSDEGSGWEDLVCRKLVPDTQHTALISSLQHIHDGWKPENWEIGLQKVAEEYELDFNFPAHV